MIGEVSFGGVFVPTLLVLSLIAMVLALGLTRLLGAFSVYRFVAYRALVDLSLFVLILGLLVLVSPLLGFRP